MGHASAAAAQVCVHARQARDTVLAHSSGAEMERVGPAGGPARRAGQLAASRLIPAPVVKICADGAGQRTGA